MIDVTPLLVVAALASPPAAAPHVPTATDTVLASVITPLVRPGDRLRLHTAGVVLEGAAGWLGPAGVVLAPEDCACTGGPKLELVPWSRIDGIDRRSPHGRNAARVGTTLGCLIGLATAISTVSYSSALGAVSIQPGSVLFAGVTGAIAGACVGGIIGGAINVAASPWKRVYERR